MSVGISQRPLEKIIYGDIKKFWKNFNNPYQMYELMTAIPIREDVPLIEQVKNKISFYPDDLLQKIIKGLWLTINDSSPYNADCSYKRNQRLSSNILFFSSMEAILRLAYLLNRKYYPHTKWLEKGLNDLQIVPKTHPKNQETIQCFPAIVITSKTYLLVDYDKFSTG